MASPCGDLLVHLLHAFSVEQLGTNADKVLTSLFVAVALIVAFLATYLGVAQAMRVALYLDFRLPSQYRTRWWMLLGVIASAAILLVASVISEMGVCNKL